RRRAVRRLRSLSRPPTRGAVRPPPPGGPWDVARRGRAAALLVAQHEPRLPPQAVPARRLGPAVAATSGVDRVLPPFRAGRSPPSGPAPLRGAWRGVSGGPGGGGARGPGGRARRL